MCFLNIIKVQNKFIKFYADLYDTGHIYTKIKMIAPDLLLAIKST